MRKDPEEQGHGAKAGFIVHREWNVAVAKALLEYAVVKQDYFEITGARAVEGGRQVVQLNLSAGPDCTFHDMNDRGGLPIVLSPECGHDIANVSELNPVGCWAGTIQNPLFYFVQTVH
jgi:hypothetical protein